MDEPISEQELQSLGWYAKNNKGYERGMLIEKISAAYRAQREEIATLKARDAEQIPPQTAAPVEHWRESGKACDIEQPSPDLEPVQRLIEWIAKLPETDGWDGKRINVQYLCFPSFFRKALPALRSLREKNAKITAELAALREDIADEAAFRESRRIDAARESTRRMEREASDA